MKLLGHQVVLLADSLISISVFLLSTTIHFINRMVSVKICLQSYMHFLSFPFGYLEIELTFLYLSSIYLCYLCSL